MERKKILAITCEATQNLELRKNLIKLKDRAALLMHPFCWEELLSKWQAKIEAWAAQGLESLTYFEDGFPNELKQIEDPPLIIFYQGDFLACLAKKRVSVIGSRKIIPQYCEYARSLAKNIASRDILVISGLAVGADGAAHQGALSAGKSQSTLAILGSGLNCCYPRRNQPLAESIIENGGAVISQFLPEEPPLPYNFLNRNRLIAALAEKVFVVQAGDRSGSLATARYAAEQGRDVWVVPGDILNPEFLGSNRLIQQGANIFCQLDDLDIIFPDNKLSVKTSLININPIEQEIISFIGKQGAVHFEGLLEKISYQQLTVSLFNLERLNLIARLPGDLFCLRR